MANLNLDRPKFYAAIKAQLFPSISATQVAGIERWFAYWESNPSLTDVRWLAYVLATNYWETGRRMQPVVEIGKGRGRAYGALYAPISSGNPVHVKDGMIYYGRGDPQLTWELNYDKMQAVTGWPLVKQPDSMLNPKVSAEVTVYGMTHGSFTGRSLGTYFNDHAADPLNARRIINGMDQAAQIAAIYAHFLDALEQARAITAIIPHGDGVGTLTATTYAPKPLPALPTPAYHDIRVSGKVEAKPVAGTPKTLGATGVGSLAIIWQSGYNKWAIMAAVAVFAVALIIHFAKAKPVVYVKGPVTVIEPLPVVTPAPAPDPAAQPVAQPKA